ncbi:MAG: HEAT repeat domain-containing protein [Methanosarcina sp.]|jgi:HEAT repeat protein
MNPEERSVFERMWEERDVDGLIRVLKESPDPCKRIAAIQTLRRIGNPIAVPEILEHFEDHKWCFDTHSGSVVRDSLALMGPVAVDALVAALEDKRHEVASIAALTLGKIGDDRAVEPLILSLKSGFPGVRGAAARALGRIGDERAVYPLIESLSSRDLDLVSGAASSLREIGNIQAIKPVKSLLNSSEKSFDKRKIASLIEDLKSGKTVRENKRKREFRELAFLTEVQKDSRSIDLLVDGIFDDNTIIRSDASRTLARIGTPAVEPLINALTRLNLSDFSDLLIKIRISNILGCMGTSVTEPIIRILKRGNWYQRDVAICALGDIGAPEAVEPLISVLEQGSSRFSSFLRKNNGESEVLRSSAARALGKIMDLRARKPLITALNDPDSNVRRSATWALRRYRDESLSLLFISRLKDTDFDFEAAKALKEIGTQAVEPLIFALEDDNRDIRYRAVWTLNGMQDRRMIRPLIACLRDEDKEVHKQAYDALISIHSPEKIEFLLEALLIEKDKGMLKKLSDLLDITLWKPDRSRAAAIYWVTKRRYDKCVGIGEEAVDVLIPVLQHDNALFRKEAVKALGKIGNPRVIEPLKSVLNDPDESVRKAVIEALLNPESFAPEVENVPADIKQPMKNPEKTLEFLLDDEEPGTIVITSLEGGAEDFLGTNSEIEKYCAEVGKTGDYPDLSLLMETYVSESYLEPEPLINECKRLLAKDHVSEWIKEKTRIVLEVAEDAVETGHNLYFYLSPVLLE